jgi:ATP-binding cassette subfamily C protein CydD
VRALDPRLIRRARAARLILVADSAMGLVAALLILLQATLIGAVVARAFQGATVRSVAPELAALVAVFVARGALAWSFEIAGRRAASQILSKLRIELVEHRLSSDPASLDGADTGEVAAAAVHGVDDLAAYFGRYLPQLVLAALVPVAVLVYVAAVDIRSAAIMLATLPLVPLFMWLIGRYAAERTRERWDALRLLSSHFLDVVRGLPTLRAFNRAHAQTKTIEEVSESYRAATIGTLRIAFLSGSVLELAATLGVALVAVTVGVRLVAGGMDLRTGLTVLILAPELYVPLRQLGAQFHTSSDGLAVADRILDLLDTPAPALRRRTRIARSPATDAVRFEAVSFSYPGRSRLVLDEVDLELLPGETTALVGESGAGKSTIVQLLLGFADPTAGRMTVGTDDLSDCDPRLWRQQVAWVAQRPTIFRGTVADNIRLGDMSACESRVRAAAALAGADAFIRALPNGYATNVGDGARLLSAGERRRIALARAFLRDAPLLILDEPTADLDDASAELVASALAQIGLRRTVLLVAHRPEIAARGDHVVVLRDGRTRDLERAA